MSRSLPKSSWLLWGSAPFLLWLTLYRPFGESSGRAAAMPTRVAGFELVEDREIKPRYRELLGTADASWRQFRETGTDAAMWVTTVFHEVNWKSVHPPHICLEGSNMAIDEDGESTFEVAGRRYRTGRIVTRTKRRGRPYLSLYLFGGTDFTTPSYLAFFLYHAPRALFRSSTSGFLLRVETFADVGGEQAAEDRCRRLLSIMHAAAVQNLELAPK